jgi:hypothetical protein
MFIRLLNQRFGRYLRIGVALIFSLFTLDAQAVLVIDSATVDGAATTTVSVNSTISLSLTVTTSGGGASNDWLATGWLIANASGPLACVNHGDHTSSGSFTETFNITAPATAGTFNVYLVAYRKDNCTGGSSPEFVLASAVITTSLPTLVCNAFRDEFSTVSYANQDGGLNWTTDWNEVGDDGSATSGRISIASASLQMRGGGSAANTLGGPYAEREADLSAFINATLALDYRESGNWEADDEIEIYASDDGGSNWTLIHSFVDDQGNSFQPLSLDITAFIASNMRIAFVEKADSNGESFFIDNVQIEGCGSVLPIDHFTITPATTAASTCLPNAITIRAEDSSNNLITGYSNPVNITVGGESLHEKP